MDEYIWLMDSECCYKCGCVLDFEEYDICTDCLRDAWYNEDQAFEESWFIEQEIEPVTQD